MANKVLTEGVLDIFRGWRRVGCSDSDLVLGVGGLLRNTVSVISRRLGALQSSPVYSTMGRHQPEEPAFGIEVPLCLNWYESYSAALDLIL